MNGFGIFTIIFGALVIDDEIRQRNLLNNNVSFDNIEQNPEFNPYNLTVEEIDGIVSKGLANWASELPSLPLSLLEPKPTPDPQTVEAANWLGKIQHPSIALILGKRRSGKSTLGYRLLEHLRWTASPFVVGLPKEAKKYLPDWLGIATSLEEVPQGSIILVDEGLSSLPCQAQYVSCQCGNVGNT